MALDGGVIHFGAAVETANDFNPTRITGRWSFDDQSEKLFLTPFTALFFMGKRGRKDLLARRLKRNYQNRKLNPRPNGSAYGCGCLCAILE